MRIRFHISPQTGLPHICDHGVSEEEVFEVFRNSPIHLRGRVDTRLALGQTLIGRYLKVVYRRRASEIFVITAYDLRGKELSSYRRRRRRR